MKAVKKTVIKNPFMLKPRVTNKKSKPISNPFKLKPMMKPAVKLSTYHGRRTKSEWMVINKNPFGDKDRDGVRNMFDCRPLNKNKQGISYNSDEARKKFLKASEIQQKNPSMKNLKKMKESMRDYNPFDIDSRGNMKKIKNVYKELDPSGKAVFDSKKLIYKDGKIPITYSRAVRKAPIGKKLQLAHNLEWVTITPELKKLVEEDLKKDKNQNAVPDQYEKELKLKDFRTEPDDEYAVERFEGYKAAKDAQEEAEYDKEDED